MHASICGRYRALIVGSSGWTRAQAVRVVHVSIRITKGHLAACSAAKNARFFALDLAEIIVIMAEKGLYRRRNLFQYRNYFMTTFTARLRYASMLGLLSLVFLSGCASTNKTD